MSRSALVALLALTACGGGRPPASTTPPQEDAPPPSETAVDAPPPTPATQARLIHAAVEARDQSVGLAIDGGAVAGPAGYQFAGAYFPIEPGAREVSARAADAELIGASLTFGEGPSTVIAYSTADFPVALALVPDAASAPSGAAQVRVFHAMVGQASIDLCVPSDAPRADGTPIVQDVGPGTLSPSTGYVEVAGGVELPIQIRAHHTTPCHGRPIGTARFTPATDSNYTLILVGRGGRRRVAPELMFCADPPATDTSCATLAVE